MKKALNLVFLTLCLASFPLITGMTCTPSQQTTAYQTLAAVETAVSGAFNGYLDSVVVGLTPTNSVPIVAAAYNDVQLAIRAAAAASSMGTNAPAPLTVTTKANSFQILVSTFKK